MKLIISILLFCLCKYVIGTPSPQQTKLESLKSLGFNISKATVTLNSDGKGYDVRTGVFTCPVAGTYMFVVDALCKQATYLALDHNKTPIAFLHRDSQYSKNPLVQISRS